MAERLFYRATKEAERSVPSSAGFREPPKFGLYRAAVKGRSCVSTSTLALVAVEGVLIVEDGVLVARLQTRFLLLVDLSVHLQHLPSTKAVAAKYPALYLW
jgi:hypothetical protein